jgi:hypothetical protein
MMTTSQTPWSGDGLVDVTSALAVCAFIRLQVRHCAAPCAQSHGDALEQPNARKWVRHLPSEVASSHEDPALWPRAAYAPGSHSSSTGDGVTGLRRSWGLRIPEAYSRRPHRSGDRRLPNEGYDLWRCSRAVATGGGRGGQPEASALIRTRDETPQLYLLRPESVLSSDRIGLQVRGSRDLHTASLSRGVTSLMVLRRTSLKPARSASPVSFTASQIWGSVRERLVDHRLVQCAQQIALHRDSAPDALTKHES